MSGKTDRSQDRREMKRKRERGRKGEERSRLCGPRLWKPFTERAGKGDKGDREKGWHGLVEEEKAEMRPQLRRYHRGAAHFGSGG